MITDKTCWNILKYILLLSSIEYISNVRADNQCTSNLDCAKFNTEVDSHVCIRWDGQKDYVCYLEAEAYCTTDASCKVLMKLLNFVMFPLGLLIKILKNNASPFIQRVELVLKIVIVMKV